MSRVESLTIARSIVDKIAAHAEDVVADRGPEHEACGRIACTIDADRNATAVGYLRRKNFSDVATKGRMFTTRERAGVDAHGHVSIYVHSHPRPYSFQASDEDFAWAARSPERNPFAIWTPGTPAEFQFVLWTSDGDGGTPVEIVED